MAELCLDCLNKLSGTNYSEFDVVLGKEPTERCEECGQLRRCVITISPYADHRPWWHIIFGRRNSQ